MKYILMLLLFPYAASVAQERERVVSVTCYVNPELYMDAGVIVHVSDKAGRISCRGNYISIQNQSNHTFYYLSSGHWLTVEPQGREVVLMRVTDNSSAKSPAVIKLQVKYRTDLSGSVTTKIRTIDQLNAQSDQIKAREFNGAASSTQQAEKQTPTIAKRVGSERVAQNSAPSKPTPRTTVRKSAPKPASRNTTGGTKSSGSGTKPTRVARANPKPASGRSQQGSSVGRQAAYRSQERKNAAGLRLDFGAGDVGLGPNFKHKFNRKQALEAALIFFKGDTAALSAVFEQSFSVRTDPGLNFYIGIGPQIAFEDENTEMALVPAAGLDYSIRGTALNFAFDWRPLFYFSEDTDAEPGRFGVALRFVF